MKKNLPIQKITIAGHFLLTCDIDIYGSTHIFIIDTGAMRTAIDHRAAQDLVLPQRGVSMPRMFSAAAAPILGVLSDVIWYKTKMEIIVTDYSNFLKDPQFANVSGIIGNDFLSAWHAIINLHTGMLTIHL